MTCAAVGEGVWVGAGVSSEVEIEGIFQNLSWCITIIFHCSTFPPPTPPPPSPPPIHYTQHGQAPPTVQCWAAGDRLVLGLPVSAYGVQWYGSWHTGWRARNDMGLSEWWQCGGLWVCDVRGADGMVHGSPHPTHSPHPLPPTKTTGATKTYIYSAQTIFNR